MNGREIFRRFGFIARLAVSLLGVVPLPIMRLLWPLVTWTPGRVGIGLRYLVASRLFGSCGANVRIGTWCTIEHFEKIHCGSNVSLHTGCYIDAVGNVSIGDDVSVAHGTSILSFEHTWANHQQSIKYNPLNTAPVVIGDDVWIGCGVRILAGTAISRRTVIAAGSIVLAGEYGPGLYAGVPAKRKGDV